MPTDYLSQVCTTYNLYPYLQKHGLPLAPGMEIEYVVTDAAKWEVDPERDASEFDAAYSRKLLERLGSRRLCVRSPSLRNQTLR